LDNTSARTVEATIRLRASTIAALSRCAFHSEFEIVGPRDLNFRAAPPYEVDGAVLKPVSLPKEYHDPPGFQLASQLPAV
jgi:hypothetical protein